MGERGGRREKEKQRERERVKVVNLLPLPANLTPKRPQLSATSPFLLLSSPLSSFSSTCKELCAGGWGVWLCWGALLWLWRDWLEAWVVDAGAAAGEARCVQRADECNLLFKSVLEWRPTYIIHIEPDHICIKKTIIIYHHHNIGCH